MGDEHNAWGGKGQEPAPPGQQHQVKCCWVDTRCLYTCMCMCLQDVCNTCGTSGSHLRMHVDRQFHTPASVFLCGLCRHITIAAPSYHHCSTSPSPYSSVCCFPCTEGETSCVECPPLMLPVAHPSSPPRLSSLAPTPCRCAGAAERSAGRCWFCRWRCSLLQPRLRSGPASSPAHLHPTASMSRNTK